MAEFQTLIKLTDNDGTIVVYAGDIEEAQAHLSNALNNGWLIECQYPNGDLVLVNPSSVSHVWERAKK